ncbi:MAG: hypothetical protein K2L45_00760 [Muribaculaceae bacterium]|nr:hypothetical protein [Muribaculaceae bacterium]MDE6631439.1 hypothetical protein [Muribaculaceae bacterium]
MKNLILPLAAVALILASCDTGTRDSYQTLSYPEYNLIIDNQDASASAQASYLAYEVKHNISRNVVDIKANDLVINNQKYSFETDTMDLRTKTYTVEGVGQGYFLYFNKNGQASLNGSVSNIYGTFVFNYSVMNNLLNPVYTQDNVGQRLDLSYTLNDRYKVQTFWPMARFVGQTTSVTDGMSHTTRGSDYVTSIDFEKKTAAVYVYNADLSKDQASSFPKVIRFENIPVVFTHDGFSLEASAPKTTILGKKDNTVAMVDSVGFNATDFSLHLTSADLTEAIISYNLGGHSVNFRGCSILKPGFN